MAWLSGWAKRRKITIDSSKIDSDLTHFPVPIVLGTSVGQSDQDVSDIFDEVGSNWQKIAVTDSTGDTQIYVEVEQWDSSNEKAVLWVSRSDLNLSSSADTELYIYFDNSKSDNTSYIGTSGNRTEVWNNDLVARYGMAEDPSGGTDCIIDSTANANHGTPNGSMTSDDLVDGLLGKAIDFDGDDDYIQTPISWGNNYNRITACVAIKPLNLGGSNRVLGTWDGNGWLLQLDSSDNDLEWWVDVGSNENTFSPLDMTNGEWYVLAGVYDGSFLKIYRSGSETSSNSNSGDIVGSSINVQIGATDNWRQFPGVIDEVKLFSTGISSAWIKTDYYAQIDNLLTFSATESVVYTDSPTNITSSSATLNGTLNDLHGNSSLDVYFEYGTDTSYGNTTATQTISSVPTSFDADISGLTALTEYHCRSVATDGSNYWYGDDVSFYTTDLKDIDETQSEFQNGTLTDVEADSMDYLRFADTNVLSFDGADDNVQIGQLITGVPFSVCAWVKFDVANDGQRHFFAFEQSGTWDFVLGDYNNGQITLTTWTGSETQVTGPSITIGQWYHVAAVVYSDDTIELYVDGASQGTNSGFSGDDLAETYIGTADSNSENHEGDVSDVRVWNKALTQTEIQDNMNKRLNGDESGLVAYYKLDEGSGDSATDSAGSNDGTINGASWTTTSKFYAEKGNRVVQLDLSSLSTYSDSLIEWTATLNGQSLTIETRYSLDGGSTWSSWQTCTSGSAIPGLSSGNDFSNGLLECRQTLSTNDATVTPELHSLKVLLSGDILVVSTGAVTGIDTSSAVLNGTLESLEGNSSLDVYFEWGTDTSYGNTTPIQTISSVPTDFSDVISGLSGDTEYHCRAVATDGTTTWTGVDITFTTAVEIKVTAQFFMFAF